VGFSFFDNHSNVKCSMFIKEWIACCLQLIYIVIVVQNAEPSLLYLILKVEEHLHFIRYCFDVFNAGGLLKSLP
jgi:hypothetical protein